MTIKEHRLACEVAIQELCDAWVEGEDTATLMRRNLTVYERLNDLFCAELEDTREAAGLGCCGECQ
jgi:hypothetical protein